MLTKQRPDKANKIPLVGKYEVYLLQGFGDGAGKVGLH